jgi:hypothetical protein
MKMPYFKFEPRDIFLGVYWDIRTNYLDTKNITRIDSYPYLIYPKTLRLFVLFFPMIPLCFEIPLYKKNPSAVDPEVDPTEVAIVYEKKTT